MSKFLSAILSHVFSVILVEYRTRQFSHAKEVASLSLVSVLSSFFDFGLLRLVFSTHFLVFGYSDETLFRVVFVILHEKIGQSVMLAHI